MFESEIKKIIEDKQVDITKSVVEQLKERLKDKVLWSAEEVLQSEVKSFVEQHVLPELRKQLLENKDSLVALFKESAVRIATTISVELQERIVKNLSSWGGRDALKKLLD